MRFASLWLSGVMIASCAQFKAPTDPYRRISSIDVQSHPEDLQQEIRTKFQTIEFTTLSAYEALVQFDEHLDSRPGPLDDNPHYAGLLAARGQIEELEHSIIDLRDQLYEAGLNAELSREERLKSIELLKITIPSAETNLDALIFQHLHEEFISFTKQMLLDLVKVEDESVRKSLGALYTGLNKNFGPLQDRKNTSLDWRVLTSKARQNLKENPDWLLARRNYQHLAHEMRADLVGSKKNKLTHPRFFPSHEREGNIVGTEFPAKVWALTFDDGPGPTTSKKVLDNLEVHGLKATFFQLTSKAKEHAGVAKAIREAGMELASHSYTHRQIPKLSQEQRQWEIETAANELADLHQRPIKFYRLPYGAGVSNSDIRSRIAKVNLIHVFWSVDTLDWMPQAPSEIVQRTLKQMKASRQDAGVILFHDIHERTVIASEEVMRYLKQDSRRVCTLEEIVSAVNHGSNPCPAN